MFPVTVVYLGFITMVVGLIAVIRPMRSLRLGTRQRGLLTLAIGIALAGAGMLMPARELRVVNARTRLDEFMPVYQFHERHTVRINASRARVYQSIVGVTAGEVRFFGFLTAIRRLGRPGPESILNAPEPLPLLDVATRTGFLTLANEPEREVVVGTVVLAPASARTEPPPTAEAFRAIAAAGFAVAALNFLISPNDSQSTVLTTETRVFATDRATQRTFAKYWRVIYPGSALIRRNWLRAIRLRAERPQN
ncbi:MAG: hypothetical protein ACREOG_16120 [Gemmatimonadaceae bacterium]